MVERVIGNDEVGSSILPHSTRFPCYFQKYALKQGIQNSLVVYMALRMASPTKSAIGVYYYIVWVFMDLIRALEPNRINENLRTKDPLEAKMRFAEPNLRTVV